MIITYKNTAVFKKNTLLPLLGGRQDSERGFYWYIGLGFTVYTLLLGYLTPHPV